MKKTGAKNGTTVNKHIENFKKLNIYYKKYSERARKSWTQTFFGLGTHAAQKTILAFGRLAVPFTSPSMLN